jgi:CubicO group peptidase (beta-lactamase class C family)
VRVLPPLGILLVLAACASPDPVARFVSRVQEATPRVLEEDGVPGAAVAVVDRDGIVWSGAFGSTGGDDPRPVDTDTLFSLQSISKMFTASAVLLAVQDGSLDLDRPISKWLPDFRVNTRFEPHPEQQISLRLLLSHRSGLAAEAPVGSIYNELDAPFDEHVASISRTWLRYPVDSTYAYSNPGYAVAANALEVASGEPFPGWVEQNLLASVGMSRSLLDRDSIEAEMNRAAPHGAYAPYPVTMALMAAGGLYASIDDTARYVQLHLRDGHVGDRMILTPESLREMYTVPSPVSSFQRNGYALGLGVGRNTIGGRDIEMAGHDGGGVGFSTSVTWSRDMGLGYVVLQNQDGAQRLLQGVRKAFVEALEALAQAQPPEPPFEYEDVECLEASERSLRRFEGVYNGRMASVVVAVRDGSLTLLGSRLTPLCLVSEDVAVEPEKGLANAYRLTLAPDGIPRRVTGLNTGTIYDYNDGPNDPEGPARRAWQSHLGVYVHRLYNQEAYRVLSERRGHLYLDDLRLTAGPEPGLYFSGMGLALDLRGDPPTWDSAPLLRIERELTRQERDASAELARRFVAQLRDGEFDAAVDTLHPVHRTDAIQNAIETAWSSLVSGFGPYQGDRNARVLALGDMIRVDLEGLFATARVLLRIELDSAGQIATVLLGPRTSWWMQSPRAAPTGAAQ